MRRGPQRRSTPREFPQSVHSPGLRDKIKESDNVYYVNLTPRVQVSRCNPELTFIRQMVRRSCKPAPAPSPTPSERWGQPRLRSARIASSALMMSWRSTRLFWKLSFRLKALLGGLNLKT